MEDRAEKASSLRWKLLRHALLRRPPPHSSDERSQMSIKRVSRKAKRGFNLIPCQLANGEVEESSASSSPTTTKPSRDATFCFTLPVEEAPKLFLTQRVNNVADLSDLEFSNKHEIDNTGLVCQWPSEDVLAYFCLSHADMFRSKRVIELGSGYGLAGFVIAAITEASEVVISDGNPQVVNYIERNIEANPRAFGGTKVQSMMLHWNKDETSTISYSFDLIVASDCYRGNWMKKTYYIDAVFMTWRRIDLYELTGHLYLEFHKGLAQLVQCLLKKVGPSEALLVSPKRGDSLDKFLEEIKDTGLHFSVTAEYDAEIWRRHQSFMNGDDSWPSYEKDHCYPLLVRITR